MIYKTAPPRFSPSFEVASCYLEEVHGKILLLLRQNHKPKGGTWGLSVGKIDSGETPCEAVLREVYEETALELDVNELSYIGRLYVRQPKLHFVYHMFRHTFKKRPLKKNIHIHPEEHKDFCWVRPQEALLLPLISDLGACIELTHGIKRPTS